VIVDRDATVSEFVVDTEEGEARSVGWHRMPETHASAI
jgi:hypothetical protein